MALSRRVFLRTTISALALPAFWRCGSGFTEPDIGSPRLSARPGQPTLTPAIGYTPLELGTSRDGYLWVPVGYTPATPAPLIVALHGAGQSASYWSAYRTYADTRGFVLLVPESRGTTWDVITSRFGGDVAFIDDALEFAFASCRIDPDRIALAGFSDGATYALSLGVSNGDLFTHLIAYSPGTLHATDPLVGKPPVFISHGTDDPILSYDRTRNDLVPSLQDEGYDVTFESFSGGHTVPAAISQDALDWFEA